MGSHVETDVTEFLRGSAAATFDALADSVGVSKRTVRRALKKVGYYSSINLDSTWVALRETPRFNPEGSGTMARPASLPTALSSRR